MAESKMRRLLARRLPHSLTPPPTDRQHPQKARPMASSAAASSSAADAAATSNAERDWFSKPHARQLVAAAFQDMVGNCRGDLMPTIDDSRLLGLYSTDPNVEVARYA